MRFYHIITTILIIIGLFSLSTIMAAERIVNAGGINLEESHVERMAWFKDAKFGMFIHWGVYSMYEGHYKGRPTDRYAEWIMNNSKIPIDEYREMGKNFNPEKYDPEKWAQMAVDAGMKYVVITSKHHDGFALFDTKVSDWSVMNSKWGKDCIRPLKDACQKRGLRFGVYYSQSLDWVNGGQPREKHWDNKNLKYNSFGEYLEKIALPQVRELLSNYGKMDIIWWDMPNKMNYDRALPFAELVFKLQPDIINNGRLAQGFRYGDYGTPEQHIPAVPSTGNYWESCMTMNDTWGYRKSDNNWKNTEELIRNLIGSVSKGGNYLLNIGPKPDGTFPEESIKRLNEIGDWMRINSESIYGASVTPFLFQPSWKGTCTKKIDKTGTTLYIHVFEWPSDGELYILGLKSTIKNAYLLADPQRKPLDVNSVDNGFKIIVPKQVPSLYSSTVVLRIEGELKIEKVPGILTTDGIKLSSYDAKREGGNLKYDSWKNLLTPWMNTEATASWKFQVSKTGKYAIQMRSVSPARSKMKFIIADQEIDITLPAAESIKGNNKNGFSSGDHRWPMYTVGIVDMNKTGKTTARLKPEKDGWHGIGFNYLNLVPLRTIAQDEAGTVILKPWEAKYKGDGYMFNDGLYITGPENLEWEFMITRQAGVFKLIVDYACNRDLQIEIIVNNNKYSYKLPNTFGIERRLKKHIGSIEAGYSGRNNIILNVEPGKNDKLAIYGMGLWGQDTFKNNKNIESQFPVIRSSSYLRERGHSIYHYAANRVFDDDPHSGWRPNFKHKGPHWIEFDLGEDKSISGITVIGIKKDTKSNPFDMMELTYYNGTKWISIIKADSTKSKAGVSFKSVKARLYRVIIHNHPYFEIGDIRFHY